MTDTIEYRPIGIIHSPFKTPEGTPIQPAGAAGIQGTVELFPEYVEGVEDLEGFSHILLIYHFHLSKTYALRVKPFLDKQDRGLFSTRAPARPNPIGISTVRLVRIEKGRLYIEDVDVVDGTPLLDIKPYVPKFDVRQVDKAGWTENRTHRTEETRADKRFVENSRSDD